MEEHSLRSNGNPMSWCKVCQREYNRKHYQNKKQKPDSRIIENKRMRRKANREKLHEIKAAPCTDCGVTYIPAVMEYDHLSDKIKNIADLMDYSWDYICKEIEKCELVCANCHRVRTWNRLHNS